MRVSVRTPLTSMLLSRVLLKLLPVSSLVSTGPSFLRFRFSFLGLVFFQFCLVFSFISVCVASLSSFPSAYQIYLLNNHLTCCPHHYPSLPQCTYSSLSSSFSTTGCFSVFIHFSVKLPDQWFSLHWGLCTLVLWISPLWDSKGYFYCILENKLKLSAVLKMTTAKKCSDNIIRLSGFFT